jgi:hypothetical protein
MRNGKFVCHYLSDKGRAAVADDVFHVALKKGAPAQLLLGRGILIPNGP